MVGKQTQQFCEVGVWYSREPNVGWTQYQYNWLHIPTQKSGVANIWVHNENDLIKLINYWNKGLPKLWKYWV